MGQQLRVALAQINMLVGDVSGNVAKVVAAMARARDELKAHVVLFPELTHSGYPPEDLLLRPGLHREVLRGLEELKRQVTGIDVVIGYPAPAADGLHNSASLLREGRVIATYHKQHLPNYSVFDEKRYFEPGNAATVIDVQGIPVALTVCEDLWHPGPVAQGVRDYIEKNGFAGAVIGLSGGIDSALTLAIAVDAIGAERVEAVMMPSRYTAQMSVDDARTQAETLGVEHHLISIEPAFTAFLKSLKDEFTGAEADVTEENIQARCRGVILMAISNKKRKILLTTGNKSEMAVGYATLYGDMAGGYAPIKDIPKTVVYQLARYRNAISPVIPQRVIERPPSAELRPDQKDVDSLPPYDVLDAILEMYVEQDETPDELVAAGFERDTVQRVVAMVNRNEY